MKIISIIEFNFLSLYTPGIRSAIRRRRAGSRKTAFIA